MELSRNLQLDRIYRIQNEIQIFVGDVVNQH